MIVLSWVKQFTLKYGFISSLEIPKEITNWLVSILGIGRGLNDLIMIATVNTMI